MIDEKHRASTGGLGTHSSWFRSMGSSKGPMRWFKRSSRSRKESQASASSTTALLTEFPRGRTPPPTPATPGTTSYLSMSPNRLLESDGGKTLTDCTEENSFPGGVGTEFYTYIVAED